MLNVLTDNGFDRSVYVKELVNGPVGLSFVVMLNVLIVGVEDLSSTASVCAEQQN